MSLRSSRRHLAHGVAAGGLLAMVAAGSASAHVEIAEGEVAAGSEAVLTLQVSHGCQGSATTELRIQMPESIPAVTPTRNAFYSVDKKTEALDPPIQDSHGEDITERVSEVVDTAITPLPDGYRDTFELSMQIPDDAAGTTLYFPTIQTCEEGETAWIEIPAAGQDEEELEAPAPSVQVVEAAPGEGHDDGAAEATEVTVGVTATTEG